jgi:acetyl-CoA carboxylase carboxyl transferase alpha subunit/acetyl-CoA carboxylase carboxyl transferase beta subunit
MSMNTKKISWFNWLIAKGAAKIRALLPKPRAAVLCQTCALDLTRSEMYKHLGVCERCGHHFPITARQRIELLADAKSFDESEKRFATRESKTVSAEKTYPKLLKEAQHETHLKEAVVTGEAEIESQRVVLVVLDFRFMGGSMGSAVGEKIARAFERAAEENLPLVAVTATGGARIQEGMFALMQMAKTAAAAERLHQKGLPYITILSHPTTGGVYASFANLADVILAEPGALIGFAGPRVVEALIGQKLPADSHRAEFLFEHGMVDAIVPRAELRGVIARLLSHVSDARVGARHSPEQDSTSIESALDKSVSSDRQPRANASPVQSYRQREPWEIVNLARRADRPTTQDYIARLFTDFCELHGDRLFGDDPAMIAGVARFDGHSVVVIGQERGHGADAERRHHGSAEPEGYRKALRLMRLAEKFHLPVVTFVDTPGADPSYESEKRGVAMALAQSIGAMTRLATPTVAIVIGEGGSGGALALAVADRVLMQENAIYSVISPEGASAILFGDASHAQEVANKLRLTARDLKSLGIIDEIVPEPSSGAHADANAAADTIRGYVSRALAELRGQNIAELLEARYQKYRAIGRGKK